MGDRKQPRAYPIGAKPSGIELDLAYTAHPLGGLTPIDEEDRGDLFLACPACGGPLVRDVSSALWENSIVKCPNKACAKAFAGKDYPRDTVQG